MYMWSGSRSLSVSLHIVNLFGVPSVWENHAKGKANSRPRGSRRVGEIMVDIFSLAVTTNVYSALEFEDFSCGLSAFAVECPDSREH